MKQTLLVICESAILEQGTNKVSLLGLFENITSTGLPTIYPKFTVFTRFEEGESLHDHKISIRHEESGEEIARLEGKIDFSGKGKAQYIGNFIGLPFLKFGKYKIEIYVDNQLQLLSTYLEVIKG